MSIIRKVLAYIIRDTDNKTELLVFRHRDYPLAGIQIPAGTVEEGESLVDATLREVLEESGLSALQVIREVACEDYFHVEKRQFQKRHFFHLKSVNLVLDRWDFVVDSSTHDRGLVLQYYWIPLDHAGCLAGGQGTYAHTIMLER
jgi:8-oxo-dGTP diphosphatase